MIFLGQVVHWCLKWRTMCRRRERFAWGGWRHVISGCAVGKPVPGRFGRQGFPLVQRDGSVLRLL